MSRRRIAMIVVSVLVLAGIAAGGFQLVSAMDRSDGGDIQMTKSVARIVWHDPTKRNPRFTLCTGSVVGDGWVLTAYHCIIYDHDVSALLDWRGYDVQLWKAGVGDINHPDFHSGLSGKVSVMDNPWSGDTYGYRDVALLHLATPMPAWAKTIPTAPSWPVVGTALTEYGYGLTDSGHSATTLEKSHQGAIIRANCPGQPWTSGQICISSSSSLPDHGDSGGPLLWWNQGYWQQVGDLTGFPSTGNNTPSYWSEVDGATRSWILNTVGANFPYWTILRDQASGASWLYVDDLYRHWIPDDVTYNCLVSSGVMVVNRPLRTIEALPDMGGSYATCSATPPTVTPTVAAPLPTATPAPVTPTPTFTPASQPQPQPQPVTAYDNYGTTNWVDHAMCRGNPGNSRSVPGGTVSQTFTVPAGVAYLNYAKVQIDPDSTVTAHLQVLVNGQLAASVATPAAGDTQFYFGPVGVSAGDTVTIAITFTATYGKLIGVYSVGNPGGTMSASNTCPDGAQSFTTTSTGLRATVSGMS